MRQLCDPLSFQKIIGTQSKQFHELLDSEMETIISTIGKNTRYTFINTSNSLFSNPIAVLRIAEKMAVAVSKKTWKYGTGIQKIIHILLL